MGKLEELCSKATESGVAKVKIIKAEDVMVADWVRLKCQYGCGVYGKRLTCLPYSPARRVKQGR